MVGQTLIVVALGLAAPQALWSGRSGGFQVTISAADIAATQGEGPQAHTVFSLAAREQKGRAQLEKSAREWAAGMAEMKEDPPLTEATSEAAYSPLSLVGPYLSLEAGHYGSWPGAAHPSSVSLFEVVDLRAPDKAPRLTDIFPEADLLAALWADTVVRENLPDLKAPPPTLAALLEALRQADTPCEYWFGTDLPSRFAFYDVTGDKVAVRIGLSHGCEMARGSLTQLGILLPIPPALRADLQAAENGSGGFLMKAAAVRFKRRSLSFAWSKELKPLIDAERKRKRAKPS